MRVCFCACLRVYVSVCACVREKDRGEKKEREICVRMYMIVYAQQKKNLLYIILLLHFVVIGEIQ